MRLQDGRLRTLYRTWSPLHALLLATAVLTASAILVRPAQTELPDEGWPECLHALTADQVAERVAQVLDAGEAGIPLAVEGLRCESPTTQRIVAQALQQALRQWRLLPADQAQNRLAVLVQAINRQFPHLPPVGQRTADDLAGRVAEWVYEEPCERLERLLASNAGLPRTMPSAVNISDQRSPAPPLPNELPPSMTSISSPPRTRENAP